MPIIMRMELVLPEPFGPSSPNIVPGSTRQRKVLHRHLGCVDLAHVLELNDGHRVTLEVLGGSDSLAVDLRITPSTKVTSTGRPLVSASRFRHILAGLHPQRIGVHLKLLCGLSRRFVPRSLHRPQRQSSKYWPSKESSPEPPPRGNPLRAKSTRLTATNRCTDRRAEAGSKETTSCVIAMLDSSWGRNPSHRRAVLRNLVTSIVLMDRVETPSPSARPPAAGREDDHLGKRGTVHAAARPSPTS